MLGAGWLAPTLRLPPGLLGPSKPPLRGRTKGSQQAGRLAQGQASVGDPCFP